MKKIMANNKLVIKKQINAISNEPCIEHENIKNQSCMKSNFFTHFLLKNKKRFF